MRPMRPKPLMPILMVMDKSFCKVKSGRAQRSTVRTVAATFSAVKPKCLNSTGAGADSP